MAFSGKTFEWLKQWKVTCCQLVIWAGKDVELWIKCFCYTIQWDSSPYKVTKKEMKVSEMWYLATKR